MLLFFGDNIPSLSDESEWGIETLDTSDKKDYNINEKEKSPRKNLKHSEWGDKFIAKWEKLQDIDISNALKPLSDNPKVIESIKNHCKWAVDRNDGTPYETLFAIDLNSGEKISEISGQKLRKQIKRTRQFNEILSNVQDKTNILLIHNHPEGMPPSIDDLNALIQNKNIQGITIGHDGSIYHYTRPDRVILEQEYQHAVLKISRLNVDDNIKKEEKILKYLIKDKGIQVQINKLKGG